MKTIKHVDNKKELIFLKGKVELHFSKTTGFERLLDLNRFAIAQKKRISIDEYGIKQIAQNYLDEYLDIDIDDDLRFNKVTKIKDYVGRFDKNGKSLNQVESSIANYIVHFQRYIEEIPIVGNGGKIKIYLSSNGDVIGYLKFLRKLNKRKKPIHGMVIRLNKIKEKFNKSHMYSNNLTVEKMAFGYLSDKRSRQQNTLFPIYVFGYKSKNGTMLKIKMYDAYNGMPIDEKPDPESGDTK